MTIPIGIAAIVAFVVIAELGRWMFGKLFGYQAERHAIPIMKLPGSRGSQGFRLGLILAGPVTTYLAVAILAFAFFRCHGTPGTVNEIGDVMLDSDARGKLELGDTILEVDGEPFPGGAQVLVEHVNVTQGAPIALAIERAGDRQTVTIKPKQTDGRWRLGIVLGASRERSTGKALRDASLYPATQIAQTFKSLIEIFKDSDPIEAGGPVRIVSEFRRAFEISGSELILQLGMIFGTYALIAIALFDLVRALLLILFRS